MAFKSSRPLALALCCAMHASLAEASDWGCEVLLCATSSSPSWHRIPACRPPMERLVEAMKGWSFEWPACPEAGTGAPGFERYQDCPAGWKVGSHGSARGLVAVPDLCVKIDPACTHRDGCGQVRTMPRPLRAEPYYFDLAEANGTTARHWFSVHR